MRPPEVILFDAAGTLIHLSRGAGWHYADVARRHGWEVDPGLMEEAFRAEWKRAEPPGESVGPRVDDDREWWEALVYRVLDRMQAPVFDREAYFRELWNEFALPGVWSLFPEVREVISQIANHYRLGVISNFDSRLYTILGHVGLAHFFEHVVVSSEVGADKPSRRIFEEALDRFDARPEEVIHVGDEPEADWRGALEAGMRVFELRRPEITLRDLLPVLGPNWGFFKVNVIFTNSGVDCFSGISEASVPLTKRITCQIYQSFFPWPPTTNTSSRSCKKTSWCRKTRLKRHAP